MAPLVTRFAPSPTGHLHVGGARTALFCWAFARRARLEGRDGRFLVRIEDTDQARSSDESARGILEDLAWLGLEWDDGPTLALPGRTIGDGARGVGPYFQARRREIYDRYIGQLVRSGRAYPAFEGAAELEAKRREATAAKRTYRYERPADIVPGTFSEARWARAQGGEAHVVRFVAPGDGITVRDEILGEVVQAPGEMDDFVIRKADGFPTYHFAVVVDDELMGVTHVLRAQEHLANTPRHVALQHALRIAPEDAGEGREAGRPFRVPAYAHMPLIFNMDGTKMSKRDKARTARAAMQAVIKGGTPVAALSTRTGASEKDLAAFLAKENDDPAIAARVASALGIDLPEIEVSDFREAGYLPEALVNFLSLLGWNPGMKTEDGKDLERFDLAFIGAQFSLERIGKGNAKFDRKKLLAFNGDFLSRMTDEAFAERWLAWLHGERASALRGSTPRLEAVLADGARGAWLSRAVKPRAKTFMDAVRACAFVEREDGSGDRDAGSVEKHLLANDRAGLGLLREVRGRLSALPAWTPEAITACVDALAGERGLANAGPIAQALRVAITGAGVSPGIGETLGVLGRASTLTRIERSLSQIGA